jgi:hypothetical protein
MTNLVVAFRSFANGSDLVVAFRSFANGSDKGKQMLGRLSIRRDQRSCKPHFVNPSTKICHMFFTGDFRSGCQT